MWVKQEFQRNPGYVLLAEEQITWFRHLPCNRRCLRCGKLGPGNYFFVRNGKSRCSVPPHNSLIKSVITELYCLTSNYWLCHGKTATVHQWSILSLMKPLAALKTFTSNEWKHETQLKPTKHFFALKKIQPFPFFPKKGQKKCLRRANESCCWSFCGLPSAWQ